MREYWKPDEATRRRAAAFHRRLAEIFSLPGGYVNTAVVFPTIAARAQACGREFRIVRLRDA